MLTGNLTECTQNKPLSIYNGYLKREDLTFLFFGKNILGHTRTEVQFPIALRHESFIYIN